MNEIHLVLRKQSINVSLLTPIVSSHGSFYNFWGDGPPYT